MDIRNIEIALRDYKRKKSIIETTLIRIETFKKAMEDPDSFWGVFLGTPREPGMPRGDGGGSSSTEREIIDKEEAVQLLRSWIEDDKSRIYPYQVEVEQIDAALGALTKQQKFIVESKYFERMFWNDIEINFNTKYRQKNYITVSGLKKMNTEALELLAEVLKPYYKRFKNKK